jgi:hypothetical protein
MRGGRVLVIGGNAFQPSLSCLLYQKLLGMVKNVLHTSGSASVETPLLCKSQIEHESAINL